MKSYSYAEQLEKEANTALVFNLIFNFTLLVCGVTLISLALGWELGVGIGLLLMFLKGGK